MNDESLPSANQYRKIVCITDHEAPDEKVMQYATDLGEVVFQLKCKEGFVMLIATKDEYVPQGE